MLGPESKNHGIGLLTTKPNKPGHVVSFTFTFFFSSLLLKTQQSNDINIQQPFCEGKDNKDNTANGIMMFIMMIQLIFTLCLVTSIYVPEHISINLSDEASCITTRDECGVIYLHWNIQSGEYFVLLLGTYNEDISLKEHRFEIVDAICILSSPYVCLIH